MRMSGLPRRRSVPTIHDVANRAGVAAATVSNVLTGRRPVGANLRRAVLEAVEALEYEPNHLAASLRLQRSRSVGIVVPDLTNPFFAALVRRIEELAARDDYQILLVDSNEEKGRESSRIRALLARRIDGLIVAPTNDDIAGLVSSRSIPAVVIDRGLDTEGFDTIGVDNADASRRGCEYLIKIGHRDIAFLITDQRLANIRNRVDGYRHALTDAGLSDRERIVMGGPTIDGCRAAMEQQLRGPAPPSAIFAATYVGTLGAVQAIRALDLAFPEQVSLLGFDDFDWMTLLRPYISTLRQPVEEMADIAWKLLVSRTTGSVTERSRIRLPCTLKVRESTRPPSTP